MSPIRLALPLTFLLAACNPGAPSMDDRQLDDLGIRYAAAWSSGRPTELATFYTADGSLRVNAGTPSTGHAAITETVRDFMTAFPDMVVRMDSMTGQGTHPRFNWTWTGTNTGPGGTGNAVRIEGYEDWTIDADGLITESKGHYDEAEYTRQVNLAGSTAPEDTTPANPQ